jgi:hypothetical protein
LISDSTYKVYMTLLRECSTKLKERCGHPRKSRTTAQTDRPGWPQIDRLDRGNMTCDEQKHKALGELGPIGAITLARGMDRCGFFVFERVCPLAVACQTLLESTPLGDRGYPPI